MHHVRHKEILTLVRKIAALDDNNSSDETNNYGSRSLGRLCRSSVVTPITNTVTDTSSESIGEEVPRMKRSERKKAKKLGGLTNRWRNVEAFSKEDTGFISEAIHLSIHETKGAWEGTYVYDNKQPEVELAVAKVDEIEDIVDQTAALSVKSPNDLNLTPRKTKTVKKFSTPVRHVAYKGGSRKFSPIGVSKTDPYDGLDPQIFFRLGVEITHPVRNSIERKELVAKLVAAIKADLTIIRQEDEETEMRAEGFWRWAGRTAYYEIMARREEFVSYSRPALPTPNYSMP